MSENEKNCFSCYTKYNPIPQRFIAAIMACLAIVNAYIMRQCLAPTITQLVVPRNYTDKQIQEEKVCKPDHNVDENNKPSHGQYDWDQKIQGLILGAFYLGYLVTHLPGGFLADKYGSRWVLSLGILSTAFFTLLTPVAIEYGGPWALIVLRVFMGAGEGTTFPALSVLLADWIPLNERGIFGSLIMGGGQIGSIVSNSLSSVMLARLHWSYVFYVWGFVAVLWFIFYVILCSNTPYNHPCIKDSEREMLKEAIGDTSAKRRMLPPTPYKKIFTSGPMWALISAQIGHDWAFYVLVSYLPKYMNDVLQMDIQKNGMISSLPYLVMWICSLTAGSIADIIIRTKCMKTDGIRKVMTGIAAFGPAIFLMAASYSRCNRLAVTINFCIAMGLMGAYYGGMKLTPIDMSPNYAGSVMAINNGIGSLTGVVSPIIVGWMTPNTTLKEWETVFWVAFAILFITGIHYCIWAESDIQPWNNVEKISDKKSEKQPEKQTEKQSSEVPAAKLN